MKSAGCSILLVSTWLTGMLATSGCRPTNQPNVILVSIDTLRADHVSVYGYPRNVSPAIDRLARQGTQFINAHSNAPWTLPSHWSMLTGLYPSHHGVLIDHHKGSWTTPTMAELLSEAGYRTAAFVGGGYVSKDWNLDRGFHIFQSHGREFAQNMPPAVSYITSAGRDKPFFVFIHSFDVHNPFISPYPYGNLFVENDQSHFIDHRAIPCYSSLNGAADLNFYLDEYNGCLRHADSYIDLLLRTLKEKDLLDRTILIVTADHGEEFMDHGAFDHSFLSLFEPDIGIPLIVRGPGIPAGKLAGKPVQSVDILPWLLAYLGIPGPERLDGTDLFAPDNPDSDVVLSENLFFRQLLLDIEVECLFDNSLHYWCGTVRASDPSSTIRESVEREFAGSFFKVEWETETTCLIASQALSFRMKLEEPHATQACIVLLESWEGAENTEMHDRLLASFALGSEPFVPEVRDWNLVTTSGCVFALPTGYFIRRASDTRAIRNSRWTLIVDQSTGAMHLYDRATDPNEMFDVAASHPDIARDMAQRMSELIKNSSSGHFGTLEGISDHTIEELQSLGYVGG
ncbi:sulfatase [bacterium]|nr:sulfatase [candidate division CSSED10-310 bacterium]